MPTVDGTHPYEKDLELYKNEEIELSTNMNALFPCSLPLIMDDV